MTKIKYRADIDGLRAVAILAVVIYHAFPKALPGGFIGVDIFFVISGYLISGILYKGINEDTFSFSEFYVRRVKRLFPAMLAMLIPLMIYGRIVLFPDEFQRLGRSVAMSSVFLQNFMFWKDSGYFDLAAQSKPLLHLWSLAVEEQFYILFPPLVLIASKKRLPISVVITLLMVASFVACVVMSYQNRSSDFYLTPYRAWEFLGGSLLAYRHFVKGGVEPGSYQNILSAAGALTLAVGLIFIHQQDPFPGWRAALPVFGSLMVIAAGKESWINTRILSHPALVWVGLISYPLYLFHWPSLSLLHIIKGDDPGTIPILVALGITLLLSVLTYYLIEKKLRFSSSVWTLRSLVSAHILVGLAGVFIWFGMIHPTRNPSLDKYNKAIDDFNISEGFDRPYGEKPIFTKRVGGGGRQTLFLGDSHMQQYSARITKVLKNNRGTDRGGIFVTSPGVAPIQGVINDAFPGYKDLLKEFWKTLDSDQSVDRVVICANWAGVYFKTGTAYTYHGVPLDQKTAADGACGELARMVRELVGRGKSVTIILTDPCGPELNPRLFYARSFGSSFHRADSKLTAEAFQTKTRDIHDAIFGIAERNGARIIDPLKYLVEDGVCIAENEDGPIRYDEHHLRPSYVRKHVSFLDFLMQ
jgi:peptidoglycan/LPS O-acetylase OafA/YrhL